MIRKPMLAGKCKDTSNLKYPVMCTPKLDGIRCIVVNNKALSRSFKPIPNKYTRTFVESNCPNGFDGELVVKGTFQDVSSSIMSEDGQPDFTYMVFDFVKTTLSVPYDIRMKDLEAQIKSIGSERIQAVLPILINNEEELLAFEKKCLAEGYEGIMIRDPKGEYKCGRSTEREGLLLKLKRFEDAEAVIVGYGEKMHNTNEAKKDELGYTKRSTSKNGMVPAGTLGEIRVRSKDFKNEFCIGSGFDDALRAKLWKEKDKLVGRIVKFKYQTVGSTADAPRLPIFLGFRSEDDIGEGE